MIKQTFAALLLTTSVASAADMMMNDGLEDQNVISAVYSDGLEDGALVLDGRSGLVEYGAIVSDDAVGLKVGGYRI